MLIHAAKPKILANPAKILIPSCLMHQGADFLLHNNISRGETIKRLVKNSGAWLTSQRKVDLVL
jgi:hypothetical protein